MHSPRGIPHIFPGLSGACNTRSSACIYGELVVPSANSLPLGKYQPPTWFPLCSSSTPHNHCFFSGSGSPQVHQCQNVRPAAGGLCLAEDTAQGLPASLRGSLALKADPSDLPLRLASHHYRLRGKDFLVLFSVWFFDFRSAVLLCLALFIGIKAQASCVCLRIFHFHETWGFF